jgi:uncharacterized membrane protein (UPF0127 family)
MPRHIQVYNLTKPLAHPAGIEFCDSFLCKLRGFMFHSPLTLNKGLLLVEKRDTRLDSSIHMFFVPFNLAVFWINSQMTVVDKVLAKAWRPAYIPKAAARFILEIHPDRWGDYEIGDRVEFKPVASIQGRDRSSKVEFKNI